jgi:hypothetical protein
MNKELIKKYKEEFNHWLDGGQILYYEAATSKWSYNVNDSSIWNILGSIDNVKIIIYDEYVEFRKAQVDGKIVEYEVTGRGESAFFTHKPGEKFNRGYKYRIKPDEPELKIGDWIRFGLCDDTICQIIRFDADGFPVIGDMSRVAGRIDDAELWVPKVGEWCWMDDDENASSFTLQKWSEDSKWKPEPFFGTLPSSVK